MLYTKTFMRAALASDGPLPSATKGDFITSLINGDLEHLFPYFSNDTELNTFVWNLAWKTVDSLDLTQWDTLVDALNNRKEWIEVFGPTAMREVIAEVLGTLTPDIQAHELPHLDIEMN